MRLALRNNVLLLTYVSTWSGFMYVAFVIATPSRYRIDPSGTLAVGAPAGT